jgi:hypothetical protein
MLSGIQCAAGAPDRGVPTEGQDPTAGPAPHDLSDPLAAPELSQVALGAG